MEIGMVGLGRMGASMARRLVHGGHRLVAFDLDADARRAVAQDGVEAVAGLAELAGALAAPRVVWLMVPAGEPTQRTLDALLPHLAPGDLVADGGNSYYRDSQRRGQALAARKVHFVDVGTSGGVWGIDEGYCLMAGGDAAAVRRLRPALETLAPAPDRGWAHVGPSGAGHFVKMVHNGVEYGLMQAYAEGFELLRRREDLSLDPAAVAELWRHGSVVRSWLLDLTARALQDNPTLAGITASVADSGEGRWAVQESVELGVPLPAITAALQTRFRSQATSPFADRLLSAMRNQFGGHRAQEED
ncbi:MAG: phosphogluconate dehydrogenase (NAD(+)-dependent, decarboxylating) [Pseudomonadota bacterium]